MVENTETGLRTDFVSFTDADVCVNCENLKAFIKDKRFTRSQIISITMNETMVEDGENVVTLFYREASINPNESMLQDFHNQVEY